MHVLDTNIISEITKPQMDWGVLTWFQDQDDDLFVTSITIMELNYGIMQLPEGKRKTSLRTHIDAIVNDCGDRILEFDGFSAYICADLRSGAQSIGHMPSMADCMIASICLRHNATLVTHNVRDFDFIEGLSIVNPFDYESPVLAELKHRETKGRQ